MKLINTSLMILFAPSEGFSYIKQDRKKFDYLSPIILLITMFLVRIAEIYLIHYPLQTVNPRETSVLTEIMKTIVPTLTWVIAIYSVTTILEGETLLIEQFAATVYSLLPYIVLTIPFVLFSHILSAQDSGLYTFLQIVKWTWVVFLVIYSVKVMNNYTIGKSIGVCLLGVIAFVLIWLLAGLFWILTMQVVNFVDEFIKELIYVRIQ